ncbi:MAG TPA: hypothetical protein VFI28_08955 [Candidatus Limnocylindrales bacterium]|nr:hypothetical protein [Candidatus Limnocylindrales bacterium]
MDDEQTRTSSSDLEPEQVGVVWFEPARAVIARWHDEGPVIEHLESDVPVRRRAVGSVRRGPARPFGGGRVAGQGTENMHEEEMRRFLTEVASRLADLALVEVSGRGLTHERLAELLRRLAAGRNAQPSVTTRSLSRRPSDNQLAARLRKLADVELPRRLVGRYRLPVRGPATPTGRPLRPAAGRRTLRPARVPERDEIEHEVEMMLEETPSEPARDLSGPAPDA